MALDPNEAQAAPAAVAEPSLLPEDLVRFTLRDLKAERAGLDGFLSIGNEIERAAKYDRWIAALESYAQRYEAAAPAAAQPVVMPTVSHPYTLPLRQERVEKFGGHYWRVVDAAGQEVDDATVRALAVSAASAQPVAGEPPEPLGWRVDWPGEGGQTWHQVFINEADALDKKLKHPGSVCSPLYTTPPALVGLSDEQMNEAWAAGYANHRGSGALSRTLIDHIQRAMAAANGMELVPKGARHEGDCAEAYKAEAESLRAMLREAVEVRDGPRWPMPGCQENGEKAAELWKRIEAALRA